MPTLFDWKRGDSFEVSCEYTDAAGNAQSLAGITVTSQIRRPDGVLVGDLVVTVVSESGGTFTLKKTNTVTWPLGPVDWDIQYSLAGGKILSTETVQFNVVKDVTV